MTATQTDLASLLCSRLCHDLLSPVGALNNGLELLADENDPEMRKRCLDLLDESARAAAQKLKFYRLAFGAAGGFGDQVDASEAKSLIAGLLVDKSSIKLDWQVSSPTMPKAGIKILLNLCLIAVEALVRGGDLVVMSEQGDGHTEIAVRASGKKLATDDAILNALSIAGDDVPDDLTPRTAAAFMAGNIARNHGGSIQVANDGGLLVLGAMIQLGQA
ncbi:histidine phosphotransferase family protein [Parasphingorhabdus sp. DH2-15]|uniref:histidine phosphotransferase family protein n=1 Tax=Parasphingorhabdus sp. DH2-15 TaxID=3444112 RepID=UPI003F68960E